MPDLIAHYIRRGLANFRQPGSGIEETDNAMRTYGLNGGKGPAAGEVFRNPDLARTYRLIARAAATPFTRAKSRARSTPISSGSAAG